MIKLNSKLVIGGGFIGMIILAFILFKLRPHTLTGCELAHNLTAHTRQVVVVQSATGSEAVINACQYDGKHWKPVLNSPYQGTIGRNGIASLATKIEGDDKSPAGLYALTEVFGTQPMTVKMDFKYITSADKFIDDSSSKDYNTWVTGHTDAKRFEAMLHPAYKIGAVINYNTNPVIPGKGSAIFFHIWNSVAKPTAGCVAMDEKNLLAILHWLDKNQNPHIYITR